MSENDDRICLCGMDSEMKYLQTDKNLVSLIHALILVLNGINAFRSKLFLYLPYILGTVCLICCVWHCGFSLFVWNCAYVIFPGTLLEAIFWEKTLLNGNVLTSLTHLTQPPFVHARVSQFSVTKIWDGLYQSRERHCSLSNTLSVNLPWILSYFQ